MWLIAEQGSAIEASSSFRARFSYAWYVNFNHHIVSYSGHGPYHIELIWSKISERIKSMWFAITNMCRIHDRGDLDISLSSMHVQIHARIYLDIYDFNFNMIEVDYCKFLYLILWLIFLLWWYSCSWRAAEGLAAFGIWEELLRTSPLWWKLL